MTRSPSSRTAWPAALVALVTLPAGAAGQSETAASPMLLEAIEHYLGTTGTVDDTRAAELLLASQGEGRTLERMWIARVHSTGRMGFPRDEVEANRIAEEVLPALLELAGTGDVEALFLMGTVFDEGLARPIDHAEGLRWYRRAAARGHVLAAHNVGNVYRDGRGVTPDMTRAVKWWLRAGRAGDVIPQLRLAEAFEAGNGVERDLGRARFWYEKAAAAGNPDAQAALSRLPGG